MSLPIFSPFMKVFFVAFAAVFLASHLTLLTVMYKNKGKHKAIVKSFTYAGLGIFVLVTCYFVFYTISNMLGRAEVNAMWKKLGAAGWKTTMQEYKIPDSKEKQANAADYYKAAYSILRADKADDDYVKMVYLKGDVLEKAEMKLAKRESVKEAMEYLAKGAKLKYAWNERDYRNGIETLLPNLNHYRNLIRLADLRSALLAKTGKTGEAYKILADCVTLVYQFREEPTIIDQLVNIACLYIAYSRVEKNVKSYGISTKSALNIIKHLDMIDLNESVKKSLKSEAVLFGKNWFERIINGDVELLKATGCIKNEASADGVYFYPFMYQNYANYLELTFDYCKFFDAPYWKVKSHINNYNKKISRLTSFMVVSIKHLREKVANTNSRINQIKILLALEIYKNKHGKYPESLNQLAPAILNEVSVDPLSGKALDYSRNGKTYKLSGHYVYKRRK